MAIGDGPRNFGPWSSDEDIPSPLGEGMPEVAYLLQTTTQGFIGNYNSHLVHPVSSFQSLSRSEEKPTVLLITTALQDNPLQPVTLSYLFKH
ncbi:hypothetical protein TNCV_514671 [Trichonephila clavipes]|nr:hypothetical protein TNCV_514671 [Trichonephila clavipes]